MSFNICFVTFLIALIGPFATSSAQLKKIVASFSSSVTHEAELSASRISFESYKDTDKKSDINIYAGYHRYWKDQIQLGAEGGALAMPDGNDTKTIFAAMGILTYNFSDQLREAFFAQAGAGLYPAFDKGDGKYESSFSTLAGFGMRFEMWGKINYKPYFRMWLRGDESVRLEAQLLNFSLFY